ncbi:MAG: phosphoribosylformylglycinamidine synthase [Candidatus Margulisiibacteriota bacterium]|nr:MAG: phosphoribosylformylglycinamidine synthase [Candidatus Margulisbacteria bacterium GWD2_39_127]OGI04161.1 MAG: phosphoribosylformylglycinamidine synthase [Candidatus Margulisbacteria bacterium GWF2_38_17]OGI09306.1 MAG: phosphoribosylformylglycinamidine synthase [Candidatus Margulisbacteria bacterium GWE2_39_32]PZM77377.1 MAG: phosphoribosylformylglycinamidine synthase [Candidatus Margulisiibacteriota bacterium]HAR63955.1 phosphoribosylformylglycinamidine synthase [Candidatus Margulisiib
MIFHVKVYVSIKESVLDPQGKTVNEALHHLGYPTVSKTRIGKYITFDIDSNSQLAAEAQIKEVCEKVLTNPIIETFTYDLSADA